MRYLITICILLVGVMPDCVVADSFESLFMPGKLIQGHAKLESKCDNCHLKMKKKAQNKLCRACHKKVSRDMDIRMGFHGRSPGLQKQACKNCHTDHVGRSARIVKLDKDMFNHDWSDFKLRGKHRGANCRDCHKKNAKWREASTRCVSCHAKQDVHKGKLGKQCEQCHISQTWVKAKFDHGKTRFALKGSHKKVDCESCHPNKKYKNTPKDCYACHRIDDKHAGFYNNKCDSCHASHSWRKIIFNHGRQTKYRLTGSHHTISCKLCHLKNPYKVKLKKACFSCHKQDDRHKGDFGNRCHACHTTKQWRKGKFNHTKTKFPLLGKHKTAACGDCHAGKVEKRKTARPCYTCHQADDMHKGKEGKKCARCHNAKGWRRNVVFDHDTSTFPLLGMHALIACEECHIKRDMHDISGKCQSCHAKKDVHKGNLTVVCNRCHNPNAWNTWLFNHNKQSKFPLKGAHKKLNCKACHNTPVKTKIRLSTTCSSCHLADDIHGGNYGGQCDRCHNMDSFDEVVINRK